MAHLEHCSPCQGLLEELTRGQSPRFERRPAGELPAEPENTADVPSSDDESNWEAEVPLDADTDVTEDFPARA